MSTVSLPYPPTLNNLFRNAGKRRIKSEAYKAWLEDAGWAVKAQRPQKVSGRYVLTLTLRAPDNRARDLDNLCKAASDLLVTHGVIQADHLAKRIVLEWSDEPPCPPGSLFVTIEPYPPTVALARAA